MKYALPSLALLAAFAFCDPSSAQSADSSSAAAEAKTQEGLRYFTGDGVPQDKQKAVACFREAAEQGDVKAQFNLGTCYINGEGVAKDQAEAVKWFRLAAEQGLARAQYNLGTCYTNGEGVPEDQVGCQMVQTGR